MNKRIMKLCLIISASSVCTAFAHSDFSGIAATVSSKTFPASSATAVSFRSDAADFTEICRLPVQSRQENSQENGRECLKRMLVFQNKLYIDTGEISTAARCGVMDGKIKKTVAADQIPRKELQSNFGKGYEFQYGSRENRLEVCIDGTFHIFACHENNFDGVSMKVKRSSSKTATLIIANTTDCDIMFGEEFLLEKKNARTGEWHAVPYKSTDFAFHDLGFIAAKGTSVTWKADWQHIYGSLKPGTYRIVKKLWEDKSTNPAEDYYTLTAKFRISPN